MKKYEILESLMILGIFIAMFRWNVYSFIEIKTVREVVQLMWLLIQVGLVWSFAEIIMPKNEEVCE